MCYSIATCESSINHGLSDWQCHTPHYFAYYTQIESLWWITTWIMMDCKAGHYIKTQKQSAISKTHLRTVVGDCIVRSCFFRFTCQRSVCDSLLFTCLAHLLFLNASCCDGNGLNSSPLFTLHLFSPQSIHYEQREFFLCLIYLDLKGFKHSEANGN